MRPGLTELGKRVPAKKITKILHYPTAETQSKNWECEQLTKAKNKGNEDRFYSNFDIRIDVTISAINRLILFFSSINAFAP